MSRILTLIICIVSTAQLYAQNDWKLVKEKESIEVFTRKASNSKYKEVKILVNFRTTMNELVAALEDVNTHKDWVPYTIDSYMVKELNPDQFYYYVSSDFPFPAKDRDVVIYYERQQNPDTKIVVTHSAAAPDYMETFSDFVRVPVFDSIYELTPKDDGTIDVKYELKVSPGGSIPSWIINLGVTRGPIMTMESLAALLDSDKYRNADVAGVVD